MEEQIPSLDQVAPEKPPALKKYNFLPVLLVVLALGLGVLSGWFFSSKKGVSNLGQTGVIPKEQITQGSEFGAKDASSFKDTATGVLEKNGIAGEGTHQLVREGGPSQTVYLTSSVLDLDQFAGRKIQVWGETMQAQKAGWFMDVGRIKVLE